METEIAKLVANRFKKNMKKGETTIESSEATHRILTELYYNKKVLKVSKNKPAATAAPVATKTPTKIGTPVKQTKAVQGVKRTSKWREMCEEAYLKGTFPLHPRKQMYDYLISQGANDLQARGAMDVVKKKYLGKGRIKKP